MALIRPVPGSFRFFWKRKTQARLERDQRGAEKTVAQLSMLDEPLRPLEACPYEFRATFADAQGEWDRQCGDWEVEATFFRFRRQLGSDDAALAAMSKIFNVDYVDGLAIAMGNQARSPGTWMLLGIIRLRETNQPALL